MALQQKWEAFTAWLAFLTILAGLFQVLHFVFNVLFGVAVLMWFALHTIGLLLYNCMYIILYPIGATTNVALVLFCKPFEAAGAFLVHLGTLTFTVLHLGLQGLYYIVVLWLFIYMLNLLYRFVECRNFAYRVNFTLDLVLNIAISDKASRHLLLPQFCWTRDTKECIHLT